MKRMKKVGNLLKEWGKYHWRKIYMGMITAVILLIVTSVLNLFNINTPSFVNKGQGKPELTQEQQGASKEQNKSEHQENDEEDDEDEKDDD